MLPWKYIEKLELDEVRVPGVLGMTWLKKVLRGII